MKKTLSVVLVIILTLAICMSSVYALTSFKVALSASATKVEQGGEVEVTVALNGFTAGETGINAIGLTIGYDKAVFETLSDESFISDSNWGSPTFNPANGKIAMDSSRYKAEDHNMLKIKFKVKEKASVGVTQIQIKDVNGANPGGDIYPSDQSIFLTIQEKVLEPDVPKPGPGPEPEPSPVIPVTGFEDFTVPAIIVISILGITAYVRYRKLEK